MTAEIKYALEGDIGHYEHTISREEFIALKTFDAIEIDCSDNQLTSLPELPKCEKLWCYGNQLASLPELPVCKVLHCFDNRLTSLPSLPECKILDCSNNQLAAFGSLPTTLPKCEKLWCHNNQLASLPELLRCEWLYCSHNRLASLPELPKCKNLDCYDNPLLLRYYPKSAQDLPRYHKLNNAIETLQARFLLKQVLKGCPWHPLGKKHISEAWDAY